MSVRANDSSAAVAILAAWTYLHVALRGSGVATRLVIQRNTIDYLAPGREGDVLAAEAVEQALAGKTGVYDVTVTNQDGSTIALFRGKSHRVGGMVAEVQL